MSISAMAAESRVPYFAFVDREHGVNVEASEKAGYEVPKLVTIIQITPHGHRGDPLEFFAEEFIERKGREAREGRYSHEWVSVFKRGLEEHRQGRELPREGTPLLTWERILKSRREALARRFPTIEDLAAVPDSGLGEIGLDGRVLRDLAAKELQARQNLEPVVFELAQVKEENRQLKEQLDALVAKMSELEVAQQRKRA